MRRLVLGGVILLAACGGEDKDPWTFGSVVERDFTPAHNVHHPGRWVDGGESCGYEYAYDFMSGDYENKRVCRDNPDVYEPAWDQWVEDRWRIQVAEDSDGQDGDVEHHWITVEEDLYDECVVGRRYDRVKEDCGLR